MADSTIDRKTTPRTIDFTNGVKRNVDRISNVLNSYRSVTYNFTLSGVNITDANNPDSYMKKDSDLIVLKSSGKGDSKIVAKTATEDLGAAAAVDDFNKNSPGRFDMFIENLEFDTLTTHSNQGGATVGSFFNFDVIEPYSVYGFIQALHTVAIAAGYTTYVHASYLLKLEFKGYPDTDTLGPPEIVPKATRYFLLRFKTIDVDITEKGTRYRCSMVPFNDMALGEANVIKTPIQMTGDTVSTILSELANGLNKQNADSVSENKKTNTDASVQYDQYVISFPTVTPYGLDYDTINPIGLAKMGEINKDNALFSFEDLGTTKNPNAYKVIDGNKSGDEKLNSATSSFQVQFREQSRIHEIITSIIRDSEYFQNKLKILTGSKTAAGSVSDVIDKNGMVEYFIIKTEIENQSKVDPILHKPAQTYKFIILPYKIHFTRIPGYNYEKVKVDAYSKNILKEYNYIYTGQNIDVLNFKLTFDTLYFNQIPRALGNTDQPLRTGALNETGQDVNPTARGTNKDMASRTDPKPPTIVTPVPLQADGGNAAQLQANPYQALARNFHNVLISSKPGMISGDLEILGDPFYLLMGGVGNYTSISDPDRAGITKDGDADYLAGEIWVNLTFRNPIDIQSLSNGGRMLFDPNTIPFSGIYMIRRVRNSFKDGMFKQTLDLVRMPGQIQDNSPPSNPAEVYTAKDTPLQ